MPLATYNPFALSKVALSLLTDKIGFGSNRKKQEVKIEQCADDFGVFEPNLQNLTYSPMPVVKGSKLSINLLGTFTHPQKIGRTDL